MKKILGFCLILVLSLSLSSCKISGYVISDEESNNYIEQYFVAIEEGDIETAINLYHDKVIESLSSSSEEQIKSYLEWLIEVQVTSNVNFDNGIKIVNCRKTSNALYDVIKGGGYKKVDLDIQVGDDTDNTLWVTFEFLKNDDGFGIYDVVM